MRVLWMPGGGVCMCVRVCVYDVYGSARKCVHTSVCLHLWVFTCECECVNTGYVCARYFDYKITYIRRGKVWAEGTHLPNTSNFIFVIPASFMHDYWHCHTYWAHQIRQWWEILGQSASVLGIFWHMHPCVYQRKKPVGVHGRSMIWTCMEYHGKRERGRERERERQIGIWHSARVYSLPHYTIWNVRPSQLRHYFCTHRLPSHCGCFHMHSQCRACL